jgi:hypothetical protein
MTLTFICTAAYLAAADDADITAEAQRALELTLLDNPDAGERIVGAGGARKVRVAVRGHGKRGGARVIYFHDVQRSRIVLLYAYPKGDAVDLSAAGKAYLARVIRLFKAEGK